MRSVAVSLIIWSLGIVAASAQELPPPVPHCATPTLGIDRSVACDTTPNLLPIHLRFRTDSADLALSRTEAETIYLDGLVRGLEIGGRIDSAWAAARRDSTHVWASVESLSDSQVNVVMLYWRWQLDETVSKSCAFDDTVDVVTDSRVLLSAALGAEAGKLARCVVTQNTQQEAIEAEQRARGPLNVLLVMVLPALVLVGGSILLWWFFLRRRPPDFWKLAARYPDKAYDWLVDHEEWWVVDPKGGPQPTPDPEEYEGPFIFWVPKIGGRSVMVYGKKGSMEESQRSFLAMRGLDS
jgi:hypothetical protein